MTGQRALSGLRRQAASESRSRYYPNVFPTVISHTRGTWVVDVDGTSYLDCFAGAGCLPLGHGHPAVRQAMYDQLDSFEPMQQLDLWTPAKERFVDELRQTLPKELADGRFHFAGPAGTAAVEAALHLAEIVTGGRMHVGIEGGYHGHTRGARDVSHLCSVTQPRTATFVPHPASHPNEAERALEGLQDLDGVASLITEIVQGEGGAIPLPTGWLGAFDAASKRAGVPLIVDEIQTGVGRTGRMWAFEHHSLTPDIVVISKAVGGGQPLALIVYRAELDLWEPGEMTGTFRGSGLAFAAGAATLRVIREEGLVNRAASSGELLATSLATIASTSPVLGAVTGAGLLLAVESLHPRTGERSVETAVAIQKAAFQNGLLVERGGRDGAVVRLLPPLTISVEEIEQAVDRLSAAAASVAQSDGQAA